MAALGFKNSFLLSFRGLLIFFIVFSCLFLIRRYTSNRRRPTTKDVRPQLAALLEKCEPASELKFRDPIFQLDFFWESYKLLISHKILESNTERYYQYGTTYKFKVMRVLNVIASIEPDNIRAVLATQFRSWGLGEHRKQELGHLFGHGIFTSDGAEWKWTREMLRPCFVNARIRNTERIEKFMESVIARLHSLHVESTVDLEPVFYGLSMDVSTEFFLGQATGCIDDEVFTAPAGQVGQESGHVQRAQETRKFVDALAHCLNPYDDMRDRGWGFLGLLLPDKKHKRSTRSVRAYAEKWVDQAFEEHESYKSRRTEYIFVHEMIDQGTSKTRIMDELLCVLVAGRDTTAALLSNAWFEIARRPDVWKRLEEEVSELDGDLPTADSVREMKYLNAILKESLRLKPAVAENAREALEDTILPRGGGLDGKSPIYIPKGWIFVWSTWALHRRKDIYGEDADEFKPERWLNEGDKKGMKVSWDYLPFVAGPRVCIGQQFALLEAGYVTARLVQAFSRIESRDPDPWREKIALVLLGKGGCKVALTPRA